MPIDLTKPLAWKTASGDDATMLEQLQPNILKGHVRDHMQILFVQFKDEAQGRAFLKGVAGLMKSAKKHLQEVEAFKTSGTAGTPYIGVGLTFHGYGAVGIPEASIPVDGQNDPFRTSMRHADSLTALSDPAVDTWEKTFRHTIDAVVLIGASSARSLPPLRTKINRLLTPKVIVLGEEKGLSQTNSPW